MSVKPQFDTYRYIGEVCRLHGQSAVECRLPGSEISGVLAIHAKAVPAECSCADGEVRYNGKVLLSIVYEDGEKKVCRAERGAEFFHKAEGGLVSPACFAKCIFSAENVTWRREGSGVYISIVVDADIYVYGSRQIEYLSGGEGLVCQKRALSLCKTICVSGETEGEDEFEADEVGDILLHSETAVVHSVSAGAGQIDIEGELALNICVLKGEDEIRSYERLLPFRMQIPADEAFGRISACAHALVKSAHLTAGVDEERGKSKILFSYCISADCFLSVQEEISVVADAFSVEKEMLLTKKKDGGRYLMSQIKCTERVSGVAALSAGGDESFSLQAAVLPHAEILCKRTENGFEAEGAVLAEVLLCGADGTHKSARLSLPFIFPLNVDGEEVEAEGIVCGLNVRRKKGGETEAEATLKLCVRAYAKKEWESVCEAVEGEEYPCETAAFSVFIPYAGEGAWELSKRLRLAPEDLQKHNPDLQFPLTGKERIFVYRQIR